MLQSRPKYWLYAMPAIIYLTIIYEPSAENYSASTLESGVVGLIISLVLFFGLVFIRAYQKSDLPGNGTLAPKATGPEIIPETEPSSFTIKDVLIIAGAVILVVLFFICVLS